MCIHTQQLMAEPNEVFKQKQNIRLRAHQVCDSLVHLFLQFQFHHHTVSHPPVRCAHWGREGEVLESCLYLTTSVHTSIHTHPSVPISTKGFLYPNPNVDPAYNIIVLKPTLMHTSPYPTQHCLNFSVTTGSNLHDAFTCVYIHSN